jgi:hypothetical protein
MSPTVSIPAPKAAAVDRTATTLLRLSTVCSVFTAGSFDIPVVVRPTAV